MSGDPHSGMARPWATATGQPVVVRLDSLDTPLATPWLLTPVLARALARQLVGAAAAAEALTAFDRGTVAP